MTDLSLRTTRYGMVPNSIENLNQLTIDAPTKVALTTASLKLTIEIDAAGSRVFLADQRTGQMVGGPEDLSKLTGIRTFITRERKEAAGIEIARKIGEIAFRASNYLTQNNPEYKQSALENNYMAAVRPLLIVLDRLEVNRQKLSENTNLKNREIFEPFIKDMFSRIRNAYYAHIIQLTEGETKKGALNECLFERGVAEYVHLKFTSQNLILERSQELTRLLFPQDPSKGFYLTLKEWRSEKFRSKLGPYMLRMSGVLETLTNCDKFICLLGKLPEIESLKDESNPTVQKLMKNRVHIVPPMADSSYVTEAGAKMKGGWRFLSPSIETPQNCVSAIGNAILRIYAGNLQTVDLESDYYFLIADGQVSRRNLTPTNNFFVQWGNIDQPSKAWSEILSGMGTNDEYREALYRWIRMECRLSEKGEIGSLLREKLGLNEKLKITEVLKVKSAPVEGLASSRHASKEMGLEKVRLIPSLYNWVEEGPAKGPLDVMAKIEPKDKFFVDEFTKEKFPRRKYGNKTKSNMTKLTVLTKETKQLINKVEKISKPLAERMSIYFRGFSDERLQNAASKLSFAQFDELFINENLIVEDDDSDEESEIDIEVGE